MEGYYGITSSYSHGMSLFISTELSKCLIILISNLQIVIAVLVKKKSVNKVLKTPAQDLPLVLTQ